MTANIVTSTTTSCNKSIKIRFSILAGAGCVLMMSLLLVNNSHHVPTSLEEFFVRLVPYFPSTLWHSVGFYSYWFLSFYFYRTLETLHLWKFEDCFETDTTQTIKVIVTTLKSGTVLSSMIGYDLFRMCNLRASVTLPSPIDHWPGVYHLTPDHEFDLFVALGNPNDWPSVLTKSWSSNRKLQCVVLTRNPFKRLISLYK